MDDIDFGGKSQKIKAVTAKSATSACKQRLGQGECLAIPACQWGFLIFAFYKMNNNLWI